MRPPGIGQLDQAIAFDVPRARRGRRTKVKFCDCRFRGTSPPPFLFDAPPEMDALKRDSSAFDDRAGTLTLGIYVILVPHHPNENVR